MNFNWSELLSLAEYMFEHSNDLPCKEVVFRTVVNRAYYSALNTAALFVSEAIGEDLPKDSTYHIKVSDYFSDEAEIHQILDSLREKRRKADYTLESQGFVDMAYVAIEELKEFIDFPQFGNIFNH